MNRFSFLILLFIITIALYSQESSNNRFNISLTLKYELNGNSIPRGVTLNYSKFVSSNITLDLSTRIMNKDYSSIWLSGSYYITNNNIFNIVYSIGSGVKIKDLELSTNNDEGLETFLHNQLGFNWIFEENWAYTLDLTYNYDLLDDNNHTFLASIGLSYNF